MYSFSSLEEFSKVRDFVKKDLIVSLGEDISKVFIAVNEAVNNAIFHGNKRDYAKKVYLQIVKLPHEVNVVIRDEGNGYLPNKISGTMDLFSDHGRGLQIIKHYLDNYKLNAVGNEITLIKKVN